MASAEERRRILKMIEEGKIGAEEGAQLLLALRGSDAGRGASAGGPEKRWFHVRITDVKSGTTKVSVNIPLKLVQVGARMGARFVPNVRGVDVDEIMERIREGAAGTILDMVEGGERFEITVE